MPNVVTVKLPDGRTNAYEPTSSEATRLDIMRSLMSIYGAEVRFDGIHHRYIVSPPVEQDEIDARIRVALETCVLTHGELTDKDRFLLKLLMERKEIPIEYRNEECILKISADYDHFTSVINAVEYVFGLMDVVHHISVGRLTLR